MRAIRAGRESDGTRREEATRRWSLPARERGGREAPEERERVGCESETRMAQPSLFTARANEPDEAQILIFSMYMDESWLGHGRKTDEAERLARGRKRRRWWTYPAWATTRGDGGRMERGARQGMMWLYTTAAAGEVFVQNGEGWLNCYRSSSHANIVYLAAPILLQPCPTLPSLLPRISPPRCRRITRICVISLMEIPGSSYHRFW